MAEAPPLTVLVVDDDPDVLLIATAILDIAGYSVLDAADGTEAMEILASNPKIDLLFTDIVMPGMNGFELAREAKQMRPNLRVAYTTGFLKNIPPQQAGTEYGPVIPKPWKRVEMLDALRGVMQGSAGSQSCTC